MRLFILACLLFAASQAFAQLEVDAPRALYILNGSAETVSKMNLETGTIQQNITKTGQVPNQIMAYHAVILVLNSGSSSLQFIESSGFAYQTLLLRPGANPYAMAMAGPRKVYVSNWVANTISIVDLIEGKVIDDIAVGKGPEGILVVDYFALVANTGYAGWGVPYEQGSITIIDIRTDQVLHTLATPTNPQDLALAPDGRIHVLCTGNYADISGKIAVIDLYTGPNLDVPAVVDTIDIGGSPGDLEITPDKGYAVEWGDGVNGFLYSYDVFSGTVLHGAANPLLIGPNVAQAVYDGRENCLWIPYMTEWGGDGFVQKWDVQSDTLLEISDVIGNGSQKAAIFEHWWLYTPWVDEVVSFAPGLGAELDTVYFPFNVLGPPDQSRILSTHNPRNSPQEVLNLGHGGEIVLMFKDNLGIKDGPGVDFTVFANVLTSSVDQKPLIEAGIVAVSQDGTDFFEFPYDLETWSGLAGVTPTKDPYHFMDPAHSGGDSFDLADVGLAWAKYVKITDLGDLKKEGPANGSFDLDAVVAVHIAYNAVEKQETEEFRTFHMEPNYPNPFNSATIIPIRLSAPEAVRLEIINLQGQSVRTLVNRKLSVGDYQFTWDGLTDTLHPAASGVYLARLSDGRNTSVVKMTLLR
jgi:YVTN family beta-propeller protein